MAALRQADSLRGGETVRAGLLTPGRAAAAIILAYIAVAAGFNLIVPPYEGFDEIWHVRYVEEVASTGGFPTLPSPNFEGHQPPAYYYLAAVLVRVHPRPVPPEPGPPAAGDPRLANLHHTRADLCVRCSQPTLHIERLVATGLGALALLVTFWIGRAAFPSRPWMAVAGTATAGFIPQFDYVSALVNNDTGAVAASAVAILGAVRIAADQDDRRLRVDALLFGAGLGLGLITKEYSLAVAPLLPVAVALNPAARRSALSVVAVAGGAALALAGWYLVRNTLLYHQPWPFAAERANIGRLMAGVVIPRTITDDYFRTSFPREMFDTFWYAGGWGQVRLPYGVYTVLAAATAASAASGFAGLVLPRAYGFRPEERRPLAVLISAALLAIAAGVYSNLTYQQPQGRFMFFALPGFAFAFVGGLRVLGGRPLGPWLAGLFPAGLLMLTLYTLLVVTFHAFWG